MRRLLEAELALLDERVAYARCTVVKAAGSVPAKTGARMIVTSDGRAWGTVGGAGLEERVKARARELVERDASDVVTFDLARWKEGGLDSICGGTVTVSIETVTPTPHVLLLGGGHVGEALARALDVLEYEHSVVDDRPEYASPERFPNARHAVAAKPEEFFAQWNSRHFSHAYLLGYSHHLDTDILVRILESPFSGVVGVIGSRAKWLEMRERALKAGVPEERLATVRCPIGTGIPTKTVGEIAIAIACEVVADHRGGSSRSARADDKKSS